YGATPVEGVMGGALSFNGTDRDYVNIADRPSLRISSGDMTISAWINFAVLLNKSHSIVSKWSPWIFFVSNGRLRFFIRSGSSDYSVFSNTLLLVNKWYHVVVVYTPQDRRATFYLDGKQDGAPTFSVAMNADSTAPLRIGYYGNASTAFQGLIDDVAIYKEAFTVTQVQQLYAQGAQKRGLVLKE
ncbi:LamG domain-containing protein, partial [Candidatus Gribaldobacteria bacterium]|nr:LamG domain-containing protein [Candidatus Gribaldobacteria bacterium]